MIRVLHLLDRNANLEATRTAEALRAHVGPDFEITPHTIGRGGDYRGMWHAAAALRYGGAPPVDLIHAFGERAVTAAVLAGAAQVLFTPTEFPGRRAARWLRKVVGLHDVQEVACPTETIRRAYLARGLPPERCHVIRPGVDATRAGQGGRDDALRRALGFGDGDRVLLAPGESTRAAAHEDAVWAASIVRLLDPRYKLLIWGRGERTDLAVRRAEHLNQPELLVVAERRLGRAVAFEELPPAADAVLDAPRGPVSTLPLVVCLAAGLPAVAAVTPTVAEVLHDGRNALLAPRQSMPELARRVVQLFNDEPLRRRLGDAARGEAVAAYSVARMVGQYGALYAEIAHDGAIAAGAVSPAAEGTTEGSGV